MEEKIRPVVERIKSEKDPFKKARLISYLNKEKEVRVKELAKHLSTSSAAICHLLRILKLPEAVSDGYYSNNLSLSHLMAISRLKDKESMIKAYEKVLTQSLTVLKTEELVREMLYQIKSEGERVDSQILRRIKEKYQKVDENLKTKIIQTRVKAKVILEVKGSVKKTSQVLKRLSEG